MLEVRVIYIYIYTIATSNSLINITLGLYVLSIILNETNVVLQNTLLVQFFILKVFLRQFISPVIHLLALIPAVVELT
jgi:hypothetical protein